MTRKVKNQEVESKPPKFKPATKKFKKILKLKTFNFFKKILDKYFREGSWKSICKNTTVYRPNS